MDDKLPEIYWFLFWIGLALLMGRLAYLGGKSGHDVRMRALDILKMYAEKGTEPPPALMDQLTDKAFQNPSPPKRDDQGGLLPVFLGFLFMACVSWALHAWLGGGGYPSWATIAATASMAFFGFGAFGFLLAALLTRKK